MNDDTKKVIAGVAIAGALAGGVLLTGKDVAVNNYYNTPTVQFDQALQTLPCNLSAVKTKDSLNKDVAEFQWDIPKGALGYIYSDEGDVGYVPDVSDSKASTKLESFPLKKLTTYTLVVWTGKATSTCTTTI